MPFRNEMLELVLKYLEIFCIALALVNLYLSIIIL